MPRSAQRDLLFTCLSTCHICALVAHLYTAAFLVINVNAAVALSSNSSLVHYQQEFVNSTLNSSGTLYCLHDGISPESTGKFHGTAKYLSELEIKQMNNGENVTKSTEKTAEFDPTSFQSNVYEAPKGHLVFSDLVSSGKPQQTQSTEGKAVLITQRPTNSGKYEMSDALQTTGTACIGSSQEPVNSTTGSFSRGDEKYQISLTETEEQLLCEGTLKSAGPISTFDDELKGGTTMAVPCVSNNNGYIETIDPLQNTEVTNERTLEESARNSTESFPRGNETYQVYLTDTEQQFSSEGLLDTLGPLSSCSHEMVSYTNTTTPYIDNVGLPKIIYTNTVSTHCGVSSKQPTGNDCCETDTVKYNTKKNILFQTKFILCYVIRTILYVTVFILVLIGSILVLSYPFPFEIAQSYTPAVIRN